MNIETMFSSDSPEWYTPQSVVDLVVEVFGGQIDLDPCSNSVSEPNVRALKHYTKSDNGLIKPWNGKVYCNPPYGRELAKWVEYMVFQYKHGPMVEGILLCPARTDTQWFQLLVPYTLCFVRGRLKFSGHKNSAPFPSMLVYMGERSDRFSKIASKIGNVMILVDYV